MLADVASGLTVILVAWIIKAAWKRPAQYGRVYVGLASILLLVVVAIAGWQFGILRGFDAVVGFIPKDSDQRAREAVAALQPPAWWPLATAALAAVLTGLTFLRWLLPHEQDHEHDKRK